MAIVHTLSPIYKNNLNYGSTVGKISPQIEIKNMISQMVIDENILTKYDNWTYHLQWYIIPYPTLQAREYKYMQFKPTDVKNDGEDAQYKVLGQVLNDYYGIDPSEKIVLLETGVTANYALENLSYKTVYSENDLNGYIHMTNMTLKFKENNGCTFKDKFRVVCRAVGYQTELAVPCFLEISFIGYNNLTGLPEKIGTHPYLFRTQITSVDAQINNTGTTYTVKMVPNNQYGFSKDNFIAENIGKIGEEIRGHTFGDAISSLEEVLNKKFFEIGDNKIIGKLYPTDDWINLVETTSQPAAREQTQTLLNSTMSPIPQVPKENKQEQSIIGTQVGKRYIFVIDKSIVDRQLSANSSYYNEFGRTYEMQITPKKTLLDIVQDIWHNVIPNENNENTEVRIFPKQVIVNKRADGSFVERIYYFIVPYNVPFVQWYFDKYGHKIKEKTNMTNTRTPIRNLADHLNLLYTGGLINRKYEYMFSGKDTSVLNFDFKINNMWYVKEPSEVGKVINYNLYDTPKETFIGDVSDTTIMEWLHNTVSGDTIRQTATELFNKLYQKYTKQSNTAPSNCKYLDDINELISDTDKVIYLNYGKVPSRPDNVSVTSTDNYPSEEEYTPVLRRTALEELHSCGQHCKINFEIIGDPFWLGDETFDNSLMKIKQCVYGNHEIIFNVKTPAQINKLTGEPDVSTSTTITGFYQVISIEHNFSSNGKFTQKIEAIIDPLSTVRSDYEDYSLRNNINPTEVKTDLYTPDESLGLQVRNFINNPKQSVKDTLESTNWNSVANRLKKFL